MISKNSSEREFHDYILITVSKMGTWRMQMTISDITKELQKLDSKHNLNLYRKQFGNSDQCFKQIKNPTFILDSMVVKLKKIDDVKALYQQNVISKSAWDVYEQAWNASQEKQKEIMKINGENKCKTCGEIYKVIINKKGLCNETSTHLPCYDLQ